MGNPDGAVERADADRAVASGQNLARWPFDAVLVMRAKEEAACSQQRAEDARRAVRRANLPDDRRRVIARPVDGTIRLFHRRAQTAARMRQRIGQRLGPPRSRLVRARLDIGEGVEDAAQGRLGDRSTIEAAFRERIGVERKFMRRPDRPRVELWSSLQDRHAPALFLIGDGPVERGRPAIALDAGMDDQAEIARPNLFGDGGLQHRRDDHVRRFI